MGGGSLEEELLGTYPSWGGASPHASAHAQVSISLPAKGYKAATSVQHVPADAERPQPTDVSRDIGSVPAAVMPRSRKRKPDRGPPRAADEE